MIVLDTFAAPSKDAQNARQKNVTERLSALESPIVLLAMMVLRPANAKKIFVSMPKNAAKKSTIPKSVMKP